MTDNQDMTGKWVVFRDTTFFAGHQHHAGLVTKVTAKQVKLERCTGYSNQAGRDKIRIVVDDEATARKLLDRINGHLGEATRRKAAADEACRVAIEKLFASAMSAREGQDPQGLEAKPASSVPQADALTQPESH